MLQSLPVQDVQLYVITVFKNDLVKCLIALIYTKEMFPYHKYTQNICVNLDM